jgi:hypothetical protein
MTIDLFWYAGKSTCSIAAQAGRQVGVSIGCEPQQYATMGWIAVGLALLVAFAVWHAGKERRRHDNYLL